MVTISTVNQRVTTSFPFLILLRGTNINCVVSDNIARLYLWLNDRDLGDIRAVTSCLHNKE